MKNFTRAVQQLKGRNTALRKLVFLSDGKQEARAHEKPRSVPVLGFI